MSSSFRVVYIASYTPTLYTIFRTAVCAILHLKSSSSLRHYATGRKVAGSIPDEVTGFFNRLNPSSRTIVLRPTQYPNRNESQGSPWG
jgi:hypothetical protein